VTKEQNMKADAWMPLYVADYLRDTMHLTTEQHGAYMLLIMAAWTRGGVIPSDPASLAGMTKMTPGKWRGVAPVILPFFTLKNGNLIHKRIVREFGKAQRHSEIRRKNGAKGGRPKSLSIQDNKPGALAKQKLSETPAQVFLPSPEEENSSNRKEQGLSQPPNPIQGGTEATSGVVLRVVGGRDE
jgi:uncharacterized protein YdaU (DUF1376 family)